MSGLLLYRQYLNNVRESIINYEIPEINAKEIKSVLDVAKDIEDLAYLDKILVYAGSDGLFEKDKEFIKKSVRLESKLKKFIDVDSIEGIVSLEALYDIEDSIIECCGELADINSSINYKNLSVDDLSFGDSDDIGANKFKTYQDEILKVFGVLESCKKEIIEGVESSDNPIDIAIKVEDENPYDFELPVIEENDTIAGIDEGVIEDLDAWVAQQDMELINKYKDREIEEDYFEDIDFEVDFETPIGYFTSAVEESDDLDEEVVHIEEGIDDVLESDTDLADSDSDYLIYSSTELESPENIIEEIKPYMKKEKLVEHAAVTDVDDVIAKLILKANDKLIKLPKSTAKAVSKFKERSKGLYINMVVDVDDEEGS